MNLGGGCIQPDDKPGCSADGNVSLVAIVGLPVLFRPTCIDVFVALFVGLIWPEFVAAAGLDESILLTAVALFGSLDEARVNGDSALGKPGGG